MIVSESSDRSVRHLALIATVAAPSGDVPRAKEATPHVEQNR